MMPSALALQMPLPAAHGADEPVYVPPGQTVASAEAGSFTTVVGFGAVVCIWDPVRNVGGMAHFLLPEARSSERASRHGDVAMRTLLEKVISLGANGRGLRAAVYGGSAPPITTDRGHLGERNVDAALAFLMLQGVRVMEKDVGGTSARKIVFSPRQGTAQVIRIGAA